LDERGFRKALLGWYEREHRDLPWRRTRDPYRIWLSEIMLQQTRAAAAIPYYEEFLEKFPTVEALARAPESEVLAAWSGLGYYSRARNLRKAAVAMVAGGGFPREYDAIAELPGVGPYTAAAVASIAFGLPQAVLDGNVMRVIARVMGDAGDIGAGKTRKRFQEVADGLLDGKQPGEYNQAVMELGATVCVPGQPMCLVCPVAALCDARARGVQNTLPVKLRKAAAIEEDVTVVIVAHRGRVLMSQRGAESRRMAGFWELPGLMDFPKLADKKVLGEFRHTIVNHRYRVTVVSGRAVRNGDMKWVAAEGDSGIPVTTLARKALRLSINH
jgi:A/G-specific adenine glycosylase